MKQKAFRNDSYTKVTGRAKYADDINFPGQFFCVPVYSGYTHAKIVNIMTAEAEKQPGVVRVVTWKDVPGTVAYGQIFKDYYILAKDKIRFEGDVAALVVAESREQALKAVPFIKVTADEIPPVVNPEEAVKDGSPLVHEGYKNNIICHHKVRSGDMEKGLKESDFVIDMEFETPFVEHAYLEPEGAVCVPKGDGIIEVYGSIQHPFSTRRFVAAHLGIPEAKVEVFSHPTGGSFGGKDDTASMIAARAALAAVLTNRPVKMIYTREWSMMESYKRPAYKIWYTYGFMNDGRINAVRCRILADSGAYTSTTPWSTWRSTAQSCGPYVVPNVRTDVYGVTTNNVPAGAFRGFGSPQVNFSVEQVMDSAAEKLGMDPVEIRKRNAVVNGSTTITGQVLDTHEVSTHEVLDAVVRETDFLNKLKRSSRGHSDGETLYGIGMALSYRGSSIGAEGKDFASCTINCQFDGSIILETGIYENGQGAESAMSLILADLLGVKLERILYKAPSTSHIPDSGTTVASRGTLLGGGAIADGVTKLKEIMSENIADKLNCLPREVVFREDYLWGRNGKKVTWEEAVSFMYSKRVYPFAFGYFQAPSVTWDEENGQGDAYFTYVYSCQAAEVEVNKKTGKIKVLSVTAAHDIGKAVNPAMLEGQIFGGIVQGMGMAVTEDFKIENGHVLSLNYNTYKIPKAGDTPELKAIIIENSDPNSPTGAKGIGEPALEITAPAIANALYNATGYRCTTLPLKLPEDYLASLK